MHKALQDLLEFHKQMKQTIGDPRCPDVQRERDFRLRLIKEELTELEEALEANDVVKAADGLADLVYVITGSAVTWGIDLASVFDEVHRSNMTKKASNKREDGKVLKDADFSPANIRAVLDECANTFDCSEDGWWEEPTVGSETVILCGHCGRKKSASTGCHLGKCKKSKKLHLPQVEPITKPDKIMAAAKDQAKILAMKDISADFVPGKKSNGTTVDGRPYTVDENYPLQDPEAWEASDGVPSEIKGEMTSYGAFVFDCSCGRRHAVQARLGSRGGLAKSTSCECICGKAYIVDLSGKDAKAISTTIEDLRKVQNV